jgi:hypothetical protein
VPLEKAPHAAFAISPHVAETVRYLGESEKTRRHFSKIPLAVLADRMQQLIDKSPSRRWAHGTPGHAEQLNFVVLPGRRSHSFTDALAHSWIRHASLSFFGNFVSSRR